MVPAWFLSPRNQKVLLCSLKSLASNQILSKFSQTQPDCAVLRLLDWGSLSWSTSWRGRARKGGSLKGTSGTNLASLKVPVGFVRNRGLPWYGPNKNGNFPGENDDAPFLFWDTLFLDTPVWPFEPPKGRFVIPKPCAWRADFSGGPPLWGSTVWQPVAGRIALQTRRLWRRFHSLSWSVPWVWIKMKSQLG